MDLQCTNGIFEFPVELFDLFKTLNEYNKKHPNNVYDVSIMGISKGDMEKVLDKITMIPNPDDIMDVRKNVNWNLYDFYEIYNLKLLEIF